MHAIRLLSRVQSELQIVLTMRDMFETRTVEGLARHIENARAHHSESMSVQEMSHLLDELEAG